MSDFLDKIVQNAAQKRSEFISNFHGKKGEHMGKNAKIESYNGNDAFYTGTDEEYAEFLENADIQLNGKPAELVENTQKINLNDTINLQSVIDRFKKTAGDIKDTLTSKVDEIKTRRENSAVFRNEAENSGEKPGDKGAEAQSAEAESKPENNENVFAASRKADCISADITELMKKLDNITEKLCAMDAQNGVVRRDCADGFKDVRGAMAEIGEDITEIKQTVSWVSKLNDSVFDLKNTQLNTKNALSDMETSVSKLKKKCVLGVTVLSILSAVVIVLEIVLMLS